MKRVARFTLLFLLACGVWPLAQGQTPVTVLTGAGYADDVYYSFTDGEARRVPRNNWDLAFEVSVTSAVRANTAAGTGVWLHGADTGAWESLDTAGRLTSETALYNDPALWEAGALNQPATDEFGDLGWGAYNVQTHVITGNRLFVVRSVGGAYYKLWIRERASGSYQIRYAKLDGSNLRDLTLQTSAYSSKLFAYLNLDSGEFLDREPERGGWQLLFTQYTDLIQAGPGPRAPYGVTGVLTHPGIVTAQKDSIDVATFRDTTDLPWNPDINEIGYDWKTYDMGGSRFVLAENRAYFSRLALDNVWKIVFTGFGGSSDGKYEFTQQQIGGVSRGAKTGAVKAVAVWPNPATSGGELRVSQPVERADWFDLQGRLVHTNAPAGDRLDVPELPAGLYLVQLRQGAISQPVRVSVRR